uniref:Uncharacterized protein n=1 Tax=Arundo donax TaxID=35708 RepID=A0A0A8Z2C8_ARUDO
MSLKTQAAFKTWGLAQKNKLETLGWNQSADRQKPCLSTWKENSEIFARLLDLTCHYYWIQTVLFHLWFQRK